jgi:toxin ParE1/3/4
LNFHVSKPAGKDLVEIWTYSQQQWGTQQADLYLESLALRMAWLTENRELWRTRQAVKEGVFSYLENRHVIYFAAARKGINILRVLHYRMDPGQRLE